jgi:hypothetical protein
LSSAGRARRLRGTAAATTEVCAIVLPPGTTAIVHIFLPKGAASGRPFEQM